MTGTAYEAWLGEQIKWMNELEKVYWKTCLRYIIMVLTGCTLALFVLGCFVGGLKIGLQNGFYGLLLGLMITLVCGAAFAVKSPRKCYLKSLKKEIRKEFPEEFEQEKFARQMLEATGSENIRNISWEQSGGRKGRVIVTKQYAVRFSDNNVTTVNLGQVKRMELDAYVDDISVKNEYGTVHRRQGNYIILFYYRPAEAAPSSRKKVSADKRFNLPSRELRDKVAGCIEALQQTQ